ncbi:hydroxyethylthiazole kinase [Methanobrevibacter wolinii]|uniref:hydroxyethylthiazole kinase n=1 Tax=Methanobrevibacter wolinii TaxID=190977 RepID=UPI0005B270A4|nr:hydroxyethylthiazole kinase [Methanobrevibacter wolinii]
MDNEILNKCSEALENLRTKAPLTQCITNIVTVNDCANAVLAIGASPLMSNDETEQREIARIDSSIVINIGTLTKNQIIGMFTSADEANKIGTPIILDPVGIGISALRNDTSLKIIRDYHPTAIRANMSEIKAIAKFVGILENVENIVKGVDVADEDIISSTNIKVNGRIVKELAKELNTIIFASGPIDIISNGKNTYTIENGSDMMPRITGTGCMLSSILGAFIGSNEDKLIATISAGLSMGIAGEIAGNYCKENNLGTGSFRTQLIDELYKLNKEEILSKAKLNTLKL